MTDNQTRTRTAEEANEILTHELDYYIDSANKARAEFAAKLTEENHLHETLSAFEWSRETVLTIAIGNLAAQTKALAEKNKTSLTEALATTLQRVQYALINNQLSGSSSSHMSNATEHTVREAYARFYDRLS